MESPLRLEPGREIVHLMRGRDRASRTLCCNRLRHEVRYSDRITSDPTEVTCEVSLHDRFVNSVVDRHAALDRRVKEAFPRLLLVREKVMRASSSAISDDLRNELLRLIDGGQNGHE